MVDFTKLLCYNFNSLCKMEKSMKNLLQKPSFHAFSDIFGLDYDETLEKLNTNTKSFTLVYKTETEKVDELDKWLDDNKISSGIRIEADIKRYYPYNNLASNLIGFTGSEDIGRIGLEYTLNDILSRHSWKSFSIYRFC